LLQLQRLSLFNELCVRQKITQAQPGQFVELLGYATFLAISFVQLCLRETEHG